MAFEALKRQGDEEPGWGYVQSGMVYFHKQAGGGRSKYGPSMFPIPWFSTFLPAELLFPFFNLAFCLKKNIVESAVGCSI